MKNSYNGHDTLCECDECELHDKKIIDELDCEAYLQAEVLAKEQYED